MSSILRRVIVVMVSLCCVGTVAIAAPKLSAGEARKVALARVPGTVVHEKLKLGTKKKHDRYLIKIHPRGQASVDTVTKVKIDGQTGEILEIKTVKAKVKDKSHDKSDD